MLLRKITPANRLGNCSYSYLAGCSGAVESVWTRPTGVSPLTCFAGGQATPLLYP